MTNTTIAKVTQRIIENSKNSRENYLAAMNYQRSEWKKITKLSCGNIAHAFAACPVQDKNVAQNDGHNIGIVTSYNDVLSAHAPYYNYPEKIKTIARTNGAMAMVAAGTPAMCDGVTQGQPGMELSLISRDVIAMATAIGLSHNIFDAVVLLGICDKIVPGLLIGALRFGHLPCMFLPSGPMPSGISNKTKAEVRQAYSEGKATKQQLQEIENQSYHTKGTCTFYGTANSNQIIMELMGLHIPSSAFANPDTPLRNTLTETAIKRLLQIVSSKDYTPLYDIITEKSIVNGIVALLATGGSPNHTLHLIAIARSAGIKLSWNDFADLSSVVPLIANIYPNGTADINDFQNSGGIPNVAHQLLSSGFLNQEVKTVWGNNLWDYAQEAKIINKKLVWTAPKLANNSIIATIKKPFAPTGGIKVLKGNIGKAVIKISAVKKEHHIIKAPAKVFYCQKDLLDAFKARKLEQDFIAVLPFHGARANGMPEVHMLITPLSVLIRRGYKVGLVTDARLSGASGIVPAAIHTDPEAENGGLISKIIDGDIIEINATNGTLNVEVSKDILKKRICNYQPFAKQQIGLGRDLFSSLRGLLSQPEGGSTIFDGW